MNFDDDPELYKTYEMNTAFQSVTSRQVEVKTVAYSFGEEAVSKSEVSWSFAQVQVPVRIVKFNTINSISFRPLDQLIQ